MRNSISRFARAFCLLMAPLVVCNGDDRRNAASQKIMEKKLQLSQSILSGVVKEDYARISADAEKLLDLAKTQWVQDETPEYRSQLKDFWIVVEGLKSSAEEKNGDGTTLAYVQMTLSCVKCHKYLRANSK